MAAIVAVACNGPTRLDVTDTWDAVLTARPCDGGAERSQICLLLLQRAPHREVLVLAQDGSRVTGSAVSDRIVEPLTGSLSGQQMTLRSSTELRQREWALEVHEFRMVGHLTTQAPGLRYTHEVVLRRR